MKIIYAVNPEWLATLTKPLRGSAWIMSEDGVWGATCPIGSLKDGDEFVPVPEGLEEIQKKFCIYTDETKEHPDALQSLVNDMYREMSPGPGGGGNDYHDAWQVFGERLTKLVR